MSQKKLMIKSSPAESSQGSALEDSILASTGVQTLDAFHAATSSGSQVGPPVVTTKPEISAAPLKRKEQEKSEADAKEIKLPENASDVLLPYVGIHLTFPSRRKLSSYLPSSMMMDFILHHVNSNLVDNYYFVRSCPDYHPYVLRLYYGVLFWIQCLRAATAVSDIQAIDFLFLQHFLELHPPASLPIVGPLVPVFTTLSASRPEIDTYGSVYPRLPIPGPYARESLFRDSPEWGMLPNVPGILALLEHLNDLINADEPHYPDKGQHIPIAADSPEGTVFGSHAFPALADRTPNESWALVSSGLQYPCEADEKLNEAFAERYDNFDFPILRETDDLTMIYSFLSMDGLFSWFDQVKSVAASAAKYFEGSGTLANCEPSVCSANQFQVCIERPAAIPATPQRSADPRSTFPFAFKLQSSVRNPPPLSEALASMAQTNVSMFIEHPRFGQFDATSLRGEFWNIRPTEVSPVYKTSYLSIPEAIMKMMKDKI